jgi:hypothetical protein
MAYPIAYLSMIGTLGLLVLDTIFLTTMPYSLLLTLKKVCVITPVSITYHVIGDIQYFTHDLHQRY